MTELEDLYNRNRRKYVNIMSAILRYDRAAAEDVVQEAFCRAIKFYDTFDSDKGKLSSWFNRILFNALRDVQKEMRGQPTDMIDGLSMEDLFFDEDLSNKPEFSSLLVKAIAEQKNEKHRRVLELFFFSGYTSTEISQIEEKVSVSNVTTLVNRFRVELVGD